MQKKYKLPALGGANSLTKQAIFGLNSARIYGLSMNDATNMPDLPALSSREKMFSSGLHILRTLDC